MKALLVVGIFALYAGTLSFEFVIDDQAQIAANPAVVEGRPLGAYFFDRTTTSTVADYNSRIYRPLRNLALRGIVKIAGIRSFAFGLANLVCYALSTLLVWWLAERWTRARRAAGWATAIWAALPVHVEAVVYRSALGDQLSGLLELAALAAALLAVERHSRLLGAASLLALALALLAKEMAITEPLLLVLLFWGVQRRPSRLLVASHAAVVAGYVVLRTFVVHRLGQDDITGAALLRGLGQAPTLLAHYLRLCFTPWGHSPSYHVHYSLLSACVGLFLLALAIAAGRVERRATLGFLWFTAALLPVLHLVPLWADLADRFALIPSVGLALALAAGIARLAPRGQVAAGVLVAALAAGTLLEERPWRSELSLWRHAAAVEPQDGLAHANWGLELNRLGRPAEALVELERALDLGNLTFDTLFARAEALVALHRDRAAELTVRACLTQWPQSAAAHALYGQLLGRRGLREPAQSELDRARQLGWK